MKAKHTPGPWKYEGTMNGTDILIGPQKTWTYNGRVLPCPMQGGDAVAVVRMSDTIESAGNVDAVAKANACLISAAPELLAALVEAKAVLESAKRYFPSSIKNPDRFRLLNVLANAVNPAIAKAEGVSQ